MKDKIAIVKRWIGDVLIKNHVVKGKCLVEDNTLRFSYTSGAIDTLLDLQEFIEEIDKEDMNKTKKEKLPEEKNKKRGRAPLEEGCF